MDMNNSFAVLIDAGFAKRKIKAQLGQTAQADDFVKLVQRIQNNPYLQNKNLYRVFYYDAPPADGKLKNPLDNSELDLSASSIARENKRLLEALKMQPFFALRMGQVSTNGDSWKIKNQGSFTATGSIMITAADIAPNITQKGVDMKIGLDMATLALKKQVGAICAGYSRQRFCASNQIGAYGRRADFLGAFGAYG